MNEVTFVILAYSRPSRLRKVIDSIHKFVDKPRILVYIDRTKVTAPLIEVEAQAQVISVCEDSKNLRLIQDYRVSTANQGTKVSYFACFDWGYTNSDNVLLLEDDMILIGNPLSFVRSSLKFFESDRSVGMSVLYTNFNHCTKNERTQITNWPSMWGVLINYQNYRYINDFLAKMDVGNVEEIVSRFAKSELKGNLKSIFYRRFLKTWRFKYSKALESRTAWDTQWQFALWGLQLKTLVPPRSLVGDLGADEFSVSTSRQKMEPSVCRSMVRYSAGSKFYCSACEAFREVQNFSLPEPLRDNRLLKYLLLRGLL
jgi:hypothetical protein